MIGLSQPITIFPLKHVFYSKIFSKENPFLMNECPLFIIDFINLNRSSSVPMTSFKNNFVCTTMM